MDRSVIDAGRFAFIVLHDGYRGCTRGKGRWPLPRHLDWGGPGSRTNRGIAENSSFRADSRRYGGWL